MAITFLRVFGKKLEIPEQPYLSKDDALALLQEMYPSEYESLIVVATSFRIIGKEGVFSRLGGTFG